MAKVGRKPGQKDKVKRKPKSRSVNITKPKNKTKTEPPANENAEPAKSEKQVQPFEPAKEKVTPYPRTGDNPDFEKLLNNLNLDDKKQKKEANESFSAKAAGDKDTSNQFDQSQLNEFDMREIVGLPFLLWAQLNKYDKLNLSNDEKKSLAEPLSRILNRRDISKYLKPDTLDEIVLAGRLSPVMLKRFMLIKEDRERREKKGSGLRQQEEGKSAPSRPVVSNRQGASFHEPKEF